MESIANRQTNDFPPSLELPTAAGVAPTPNGQHGHVGLQFLAVPRRGPLRLGAGAPKLVAAAGGDGRGRHGPSASIVGVDHGANLTLTSSRRLASFRALRAGLHKECDPHRRIRQAAIGRRQVAARGHFGRVQTAVAADHDDFAGLHPGRSCCSRWSPRCRAENAPRTLGTAVFAGMLGVTLFGIFLQLVTTSSSGRANG